MKAMKQQLIAFSFSVALLVGLTSGCSKNSPSSETVSGGSNTQTMDTTTSQAGQFAPIAGKWVWQTAENKKYPEASKVTGVFNLTQTPTGDISGDTSVVLPVAQKKKDGTEPKYFVDVKLLKGKFTDKNSFTFEVRGEDGAITTSEATVDEAGSTITGKSTLTMKPDPKYANQSEGVNFSYEWTAKKAQ